MQNHWVVKTRQKILAIFLMKDHCLVYKDHLVFFYWKAANWKTTWDLWRNWTTLWRKRTTNCWSLLMSCVQCASRHKEASTGGGSFAPQGVLIARQILAFCVARIICLTISTNLLSWWIYQDHRWSLSNKSVVLHKRRSKLCYWV